MPKQDPPPPPDKTKKRTSWRYSEWPNYVNGTVTEVTNTSITIQSEEGMAAVQYPAHTALASGGVMEDAYGCSSYHFRDVKVGDVVCIGAVKEDDGKTYCIGICIEKRPGGRLPACPKWDSKTSASHAEYKNALADLEEFGTPLPDKVRRGMSSDEPEAKKSDAIKAALKAKETPPEKIEKVKD